MNTNSLYINRLQRVPRSWLLPLDDQEPTIVDGPISRYADLDVGLHFPDFIKLNKSWTWTSIYYYEINGRISIYVAERDPHVYFGSIKRLHGIAKLLQTDPTDKVRIMHQGMDHNHAMFLLSLAPGFREILFMHYHHPDPTVRNNIGSAWQYMQTAGKKATHKRMSELLYGTS